MMPDHEANQFDDRAPADIEAVTHTEPQYDGLPHGEMQDDTGQQDDEPWETQQLRTAIDWNADYYLHQWEMVDTDRSRGVGFNWGAFVFSGLWLAFRKMYRVAFLYYGIFLAWATFEELVLVRTWNLEMPNWLFSLIRLAPPAVCGLLANQWYRHHIVRLVADASEEAPDHDARLALLQQRGGTSVIAACSMVLLFSIAAVTIIMVIGVIPAGK